MESVYCYKNLTKHEIRLLKLTSENGKISSKFNICSISSPLKFTALSYAWGSPSRNNNLAIDRSTIKITESVYNALPYLCQHLDTEYVWIDGVCIDQDKQSEKETQIPLMREIYSKAAEVLIWLGESDDEIDAAMDAIPSLNEKLGDIDGMSSTIVLNQALVEAGLAPISSPIWRGFTKLYSRPWFSRLWTFQEAVLAKNLKVSCGEKIVPFEIFQSFTTTLRSSGVGRLSARDEAAGHLVAAAYTKMGTIALHRDAPATSSGKPFALSILVGLGRYYSVTNPLDRIYGMLGLCTEDIPVDYSLSPATVYSAYVLKDLKASRSLDLLHAASSNEPMRDLPSWCPNLDAKAKTAALGLVSGLAGYCAGKGPRTQLGYPIGGDEKLKTLHLTGIQVDIVDRVVPSTWNKFFKPGSPPAPIPSHNLEWMKACLRLSQSVFEEPETVVPEVHCRTLIANKDSKNNRYTKDGKKCYNCVRIVLARGAENQEFEDRHKQDAEAFDSQSSAEDGELRDYMQALTYACHKRRFFSTKHGRIGLGPSNTRPGDLICIFYNGYTPFIIRPAFGMDMQAANRFVGEAYVDGLMYGEYLKWETRPAEQIFVLC